MLPLAQFVRILRAARELGCSLGSPIATVDSPDNLDKRRARAFARDVERIRSQGALLDLDDDLESLAAVAGWCARANGGAWLQIRLLHADHAP